MNTLLALWNGPIQNWGFVDLAIFVVIVAAIAGICAFVCIFAIRLIAGM